MARLIENLDSARIAENLKRIRQRVGDNVEILAATKYVTVDDMGILAEAGVRLVGENRQQDMEAKHERWGNLFEWDFIGGLQSRKVKRLIPITRLIHSVASESALVQLGRHGSADTEILLEVNVSGEEAKAGIEPATIGEFIGRSEVSVVGLMTMPPFAHDPGQSRSYFARLAALAAEHGLPRLSMGTSQDWQVAVEEGATIIRLGETLLS